MTAPASPRNPGKPNLYGKDRAGLKALLAEYGAPAFHAEQLFHWLYSRGALRPDDWTDLPLALRSRIADQTVVDAGRISDRSEAADGTVKFKVDLSGGRSVESVFMTQSGRVTLCISSQVGCALACSFCMTGKMGFVRHLGPGEIVGQVLLILREMELGDRSFNIVFMGMGEPLHNYDAVRDAFLILTDARGFGLSRRRITVSTVGLAPAIERLAGEPSRPRLAVSLNATTDAVRDRLMPVNRKYPLRRLFEACRTFSASTREMLSFEYVLLAGINDSDDDADRLARYARRLSVKVNLIPFNEVPGWLPYRAPTPERVGAIRDRMLRTGVRVSIRWSRGAEARAACGQLALLPRSE